MLEKALTSESVEKGIEYLQQLEKLFYDDAMIIPISTMSPPEIVQPYVKGFIGSYGGVVGNQKVNWTWLDK